MNIDPSECRTCSDLANQLAAANARCAELEAERDVLRGSWRDSLEAWNTYNEGFGYSGDFDRPIMAAFRTGFDTGRAERDALQATLDRVTALAESRDHDRLLSGTTMAYEIRTAIAGPPTHLRAALTPEGKCKCGHAKAEHSSRGCNFVNHGSGCEIHGCTCPEFREGKP